MLLESVRRGDEQAFRRLHRLHAPFVFRMALRLTGGSDADAHDVLQETWLRAVRGLGRFEARSSFRTWLGAIATRTALEIVRARTRSLGDAEADAPPARPHAAAPGRDIGHGSAPEVRGADGAARLDVERMLAAMPEGYRTVLVLHDLEGFKHAEIAELTGISEGTSKSQLSRARAWARAAMGDDYTRR